MAGGQPGGQRGREQLSARELEVVQLVGDGMTDREIAGRLFISVRTVRSHLDRIRDKTGCRRRSELTRLALGHFDRVTADRPPAPAAEPVTSEPPPRPPFVGRDSELAQLLAGVASSRTASVPTLLAGEAGVGKTRLLEELAGRAAEEGVFVAYASAEDDDILPYRPFSEIVRAIAAAPFGAGVLEKLGTLVDDLATLVPEIAPFEPAIWSADAEVARARLFEAVTTLVALASEGQAVAVVLDDAQCIGRATGALVRTLLTTARARVALILSTRLEGDRIPAPLGELVRDREPQVITLSRLGSMHVAAWLECESRRGARPRHWAGDAGALHRLTGGLPLLVHAVLAGDAPARSALAAGATAEPLRVDQVVAERTAALSGEARLVLDLAALSGRSVDAATLAAVTGGSPRTVERLLDGALEQAGLLLRSERHGSYRWAHDLLREAVLDGIPPDRRDRLHDGLSGALAEEGLTLHAARQALAAFHGHAGRVLSIAVAAVDEAIDLLAFETAEELCRRALDLAYGAASVDDAVSLLSRLGLCLALTGQREEAEGAWLDAARRAVEAGRSDLFCRAALATDPLRRASEDSSVRWALLEQAVHATDVDDQLRTEVACAWLEEAVMPQHGTTEAALAAGVLDTARAVGQPVLLLRALDTAHTVARATQRLRPELALELCEVADGLGDPSWQARAELAALLESMIALDRGGVEEHLPRLLAAAGCASAPRIRWHSKLVAATWELLEGRVDEAGARAAEAAAFGESYGISDAGIAFAVHQFFRAFHAGSLGALAELLAHHAARHPELPAWRAGAGLALASTGDRSRACELRDGLFPAVTRPGVDESWPLTACLTAQLCHETAAPADQREPLRRALAAYEGRMAVLAAGVAECGPVARYVGLLAAPADPAAAILFLRQAESECRSFGAELWLKRTERDLLEVTQAIGPAR